MVLSLSQVDLFFLAEALDDASWENQHFLDPRSGQMHVRNDLMGSDFDEDEDEVEEWLSVEGEGSRAAYRVMEVFAASLADRRLGERLAEALDGKGAFRRFRDTLHRHGDEATVRAWQAFERTHSELRALDWLEGHDLVDRSELAAARAERETALADALAPVTHADSGARLVLLNGMPGAGKSTLAERYRSEHPGVLVVEADVIRTWIGGDPAEHAEAARHLSLAMARAHLEAGYDVVVPQLVARLDQVERFEGVAVEAGADLVEVVLHGGVVESRVPEDAVPHLVEYAEGLAHVVAARPATHRLATRHGDVDSAYRALVDLLDPDLPA
jgi:predicted kinase